MMHNLAWCSLCNPQRETVLVANKNYRIILVNDDPAYLGYLRLIVNRHVKEMTDLSSGEVHELLQVLLKLERCVRDSLAPDKINLASLGNQTPHVHWHIIPRYIDDKHYPNSIWGEVTNPNYVPAVRLFELQDKLVDLIKTQFCGYSD